MIRLPDRPRPLRAHPVAAWRDPVVIPSYAVGAPDRNPMFLERRVYQGSSGRVYPNPVIDRVSDRREDRAWSAIHLENEYIRLMVLPEIGGRIHVGLDRTDGYDFFYRQNVIKPALVGLLGPWISGGVEFNWPQHHRPSTFMPVDWAIEELPDGGRTVWCSEHEPMGRMKGMHGVTLRPGSSVVELRVRLFNRTPQVQTFLWWANVAARVHDRYQSFFPPDVRYVADHAKRATSAFPVSRSRYYGIEYGDRPPCDADLSWYKNIPVPTSYMAMGTSGDFFGGYDHTADAGFVHWADHQIAPGKKQWTWGSGEFGQAWDRELTDDDGPYVELMAGVYTDNQPDFSFLAPYETKTFSQYWYPIRQIGPAHAATRDGAVSLTVHGGLARIGIAATSVQPAVTVRLQGRDGVLLKHTADLSPGRPLIIDGIRVPAGNGQTDLELLAEAASGRVLARYRPPPLTDGEPPPAAREPPPPGEIDQIEDLYLTGLHLEQYRHATRRPEDYWAEALRRSPGDARCNTASGWWRLRRGEFEAAVRHFRTAVATLTTRNPNPYDGEPRYGLGLALRYAGRPEEADEAFGKAAWNNAWRGPAEYARAQLAARRGRFAEAIALLDRVAGADSDQLAARTLRAGLWRRLGEAGRAAREIDAVLAADPLDAWAREERRLAGSEPSAGPRSGEVQTALDVAHDYAAAGLLTEAIGVLSRQLPDGPDEPVDPIVRYTLAWLLGRAGDSGSDEEFRRAAALPSGYCFPARLEEIEILQAAMTANPADARAPYYLGNLYYDRHRYTEAIAVWRRAARLDPSFPTVHRNLGIAEFNVLGRPGQAQVAYRRALRADPADARVLYEYDQLRRRCGEPPAARLRLLERHRGLVASRDDLTIEFIGVLNRLGRHEEALAILASRRFHPWEGGEGLVSAQWVLANLRLGQAALSAADPVAAIERLAAALLRPPSLGEGKHPLTCENEVHYHLGLAHLAAGHESEAQTWLTRAAAPQGDNRQPPGEAAYWQAQALRARGDEAAAAGLLRQLLRSARRRAAEPQRTDYFATSLPAFGIFDDDLGRRNQVECRYLESLARAALGQRRPAERGLREVLTLDPGHQGAAWHLQALTESRLIAKKLGNSRPIPIWRSHE